MKNTSILVEWKQRAKGIYDSPCMDLCNFRNEKKQCNACGLLRSEKKGWKNFSVTKKKEISESCLNRTPRSTFDTLVEVKKEI